MDSCVILAAYLKWDVIRETCENTQPFLNMNEKDGIYYYRIIIILKMLLVTSIFLQDVSNRFSHLLFAVSNALLATMYREIALLPAVAQCLLIFAPNKRFALFVSVSWISILAMNIKSYEFILDVGTLCSLLYYSWKAYERELQKLWTVIYMMLSLGWYVSGLDVYGLDRFFLVIGFLVLAYIPLRPHWLSKHRDRLNFIYALMFLWVVFKFQLFQIQPVVPQFKTVNITEVSKKLASCALTDNLTSEVGDQFMHAKYLHESNNIESVCPKQPLFFEKFSEKKFISSEMKEEAYRSGRSTVEDHLQDSINSKKNTQKIIKKILTEEPEVYERFHDDQNMHLEDRQLEPVEKNDHTNFLQAEETKSKYSPEASTESMKSSLADISKYENQKEECYTKNENKLSAEEFKIYEECHDQDTQRDEDKDLETVEENDRTKNVLEAKQNNFIHSSEIFRESMESPLTEISKYENQKEEWYTKDENKLSEDEPEVNEMCHDQNMQFGEDKDLERAEENDHTENVYEAKQNNFIYSSEIFRESMESPLTEISKYENQEEEWYTKNKLSEDEPEVNEMYHDQNIQRDEDKDLKPVEENDRTKNALEAKQNNFRYSSEIFPESTRISPLTEISKYENQNEEWYTKDENKLSEDEHEVNEMCHDQNMQRDEEKDLGRVEENDHTENVLEAKQNNFIHSSVTFRESIENPLKEISKHENKKEGWHSKDEIGAENFEVKFGLDEDEIGAENFEVKFGLDENKVEPEQNSGKTQIFSKMEELQTTERTDSKETFSLDTRLDDTISTNTKHCSAREPDVKRNEKREKAIDELDSHSIVQSMESLEETEVRPSIEENPHEYSTTSEKLKSAKTDEGKTRSEMIKEDFTNRDSGKKNEEKNIKSVFDGKSKLNSLKQVNIRDEIVTLDKKSEDKSKSDEATELSENEILKFIKDLIEGNENVEKVATSKIFETNKIGTEFTKEDIHVKSEVKDVLEKKFEVFSTQSDGIVLHKDQEKPDESQLDKKFTYKSKKGISNTRLMTNNVGGNTDSGIIVGRVQNKNRKQLIRDTNLVKDELPNDIDMDFVAKGRVNVQKEKPLDSSDLHRLKSSYSPQKLKQTIKIPPKKVYIKHMSTSGKENKVNVDVLNSVEEIIQDGLEIPDDSIIRDTVKKMKNTEDALKLDGLGKVNSERNIMKNKIKIAGNVMGRKSESANHVERNTKKPILRDVRNLQGESKSRDVFEYRRSKQEAKRPDASKMFDFESENIDEWEESFKTHLMQEGSASDDIISLNKTKKQRMAEDQTIMKNLLESFDDSDTNEERFNTLQIAEYLRENYPFDLGLMDDYTYLVNEDEDFYADESMEDNAVDQRFEVADSDYSTTDENQRNDRMYVVYRKRSGQYYIM